MLVFIHSEVQENTTGREAHVLMRGVQQRDHELVYWEGREQTWASEARGAQL